MKQQLNLTTPPIEETNIHTKERVPCPGAKLNPTTKKDFIASLSLVAQ
jgi:hypothetical protein